MAIEVNAIEREFIIESNNVSLPDPDRNMLVEEVQQFYSSTYTELTVATYQREFTGEKEVITFKTVIGTKG